MLRLWVLSCAALAAMLMATVSPAAAQTKEECVAAYAAISDALDHRGPNKPHVPKEAYEWALDYQGKHGRGELCDSLPDFPETDPIDSALSELDSLKSLSGETAFKAGMAHIEEGDKPSGISMFKRACEYDHADGCYAYATYVGFQAGNYDTPEVVAITQKACRLGSNAACKAERRRAGKSE